ncbi:MAG: amidohydrolase, partial [Woeseiaceae bacterium]
LGLFALNPTAYAEGAVADLILHGAKVVTVDGDFSIRKAVAIRGDRIVAVGNDREIGKLAGPETLTIDLGGRTVIPGLIDSHIHALGYGLHITEHVMFSTGERLTVEAMLAKIAEHAARKPAGEWIYVRGPYSLDFVEEGRLPNRAELDIVAPNNPLFINMQGHVGVVNSRAIALSGVSADTPNPPNGIFVRDPASGELTGLLYEFPAFTPFLKDYPGYTLEEWLHAAASAEEVFNAYGLTSVVDLWTSKQELAVLTRLANDGKLNVRWSTVLKLAPEDYSDKSYEEVEQELLQFWPVSPPDSDWLTVNGIKIIFDGFAEAAYMHDPYLQEKFGADWHGVAFWDQDTLLKVLNACARHDIQAFVHVAGDAALSTVLDAMKAVNEQTPIHGRRWTLEHASTMPSTEQLRLAQEMEIVISTQQAMGWSIGKTFKEFWGLDRGAVFAPNRTWLEELGHPYLKAGSDNRPIDPFIGFWAYLAREDVTGDVGRPDEILSRADVLRLYTANGAYGIFEESDRGSIERGKLADLVVLSDDILTVPINEVRTIRPVMTMVGGRIKYHSDGNR